MDIRHRNNNLYACEGIGTTATRGSGMLTPDIQPGGITPPIVPPSGGLTNPEDPYLPDLPPPPDNGGSNGGSPGGINMKWILLALLAVKLLK